MRGAQFICLMGILLGGTFSPGEGWAGEEDPSIGEASWSWGFVKKGPKFLGNHMISLGHALGGEEKETRKTPAPLSSWKAFKKKSWSLLSKLGNAIALYGAFQLVAIDGAQLLNEELENNREKLFEDLQTSCDSMENNKQAQVILFCAAPLICGLGSPWFHGGAFIVGELISLAAGGKKALWTYPIGSWMFNKSSAKVDSLVTSHYAQAS
jgi:hypothetical protein